MPKVSSLNQKIHKWLSGPDGHGIYDAAALADDFKKETGLESCWPVHTARYTAKAIMKRGLGGRLDLDASGNAAWGWEIADALADKYGHESRHGQFMGRGSVFHAALDSLKEE
jgi:hypothetical protein